MKQLRTLHFLGIAGVMACITLACGCMTPATASPSTIYSIVMKTPSCFIVDDEQVDIADLVKVLKTHKYPQTKPLIIHMPANTSTDTINLLTQKLATAGFKPVWKGPRHATSFVNGAR